MKSPLLYIVEMLFCSGILLAFYRLVLVRRVSFRVCRLYLVAALLLSAVIPALEIPVYPASVRNPDSVQSEWLQEAYPAGPAAVGEAAGEAVSGTQPRPATPRYALPLRLLPAAACAAVTLLSLGLLVVRLYRIRRLRRRSRLTPCAGYTLAENPQVAAPFSFLRTVFLGPGYEGERRAMVLCHEAGHVRHLHSVECLIVEFVRSLFWFNPFVWIAQRWLKEVHEWEADREVLDAGYDLTRYRIVLFHQLFGYNPDIACGLNHSLTKKRFAMMTRCNNRRHAALRLGAALPVLAGLVLLCSFTAREPEPPAVARTSSGDDPLNLDIRIGRDSVWVDGTPASGDRILELIARKRDHLSEEERPRLTVTLRADGEVCMGAVTDLKEQMREARVLRVRYETASCEVSRMLPPRIGPSPDGAKPGVVPCDMVECIPGDSLLPDSFRLKIAERNCFLVSVNARGRMLAGTVRNRRECTPDELKALAREFLLNPTDDRSLSEHRPTAICLPDGRTEHYAEYLGMFGIQIDRATPYAVYAGVQQALSEVYADLRADLARKWFGSPFDGLDAGQRACVLRALPIRITEIAPKGI